MTEGENFLTIREFAHKVNYSERQVRQMCIDGKIKAQKLTTGSRKWLIPESEAMRFIAGTKPQLNEIQPHLVEAPISQDGDLTLVPKLMALLGKGYHTGKNKCPIEELPIPSAQYWNHVLLPSQREKVLELVMQLGQNPDDYEELIKKRIPGRPSDIQVHWKR